MWFWLVLTWKFKKIKGLPGIFLNKFIPGTKSLHSKLQFFMYFLVYIIFIQKINYLSHFELKNIKKLRISKYEIICIVHLTQEIYILCSKLAQNEVVFGDVYIFKERKRTCAFLGVVTVSGPILTIHKLPFCASKGFSCWRQQFPSTDNVANIVCLVSPVVNVVDMEHIM